MFLLFIQAGIVSNGFYFLIHIDLFNVHWLVSVLFSIPCTTSSVAIGFYGTKLFIFVQSTQLNGLKWNMFIASANTDVNFTNSRRICENFSKTSNFNCEYCVSLWKKILIRRLLLCVHNCSYIHDLKELSDIKSIHRKQYRRMLFMSYKWEDFWYFPHNVLHVSTTKKVVFQKNLMKCTTSKKQIIFQSMAIHIGAWYAYDSSHTNNGHSLR